MLGRVLLAIVMVGATAAPSCAAGPEAFTDPAKAGLDYKIQGEYKGELKVQDESAPFGAQVIALGDGKFRGVFYFGGLPGDGWKRGDMQLSVDSATEDGKVTFTGDNGSAKIASRLLQPSRSASSRAGNTVAGTRGRIHSGHRLGIQSRRWPERSRRSHWLV